MLENIRAATLCYSFLLCLLSCFLPVHRNPQPFNLPPHSPSLSNPLLLYLLPLSLQPLNPPLLCRQHLHPLLISRIHLNPHPSSLPLLYLVWRLMPSFLT